MNGQSLGEFVRSERSALERGDGDVANAVAMRPLRGTDVALGLLALGQVEEAKRWFDALSREWLRRGDEISETKFEKNDVQKARRRPWNEYYRSLQTAILGFSDVDSVAQRAFNRVTQPFVDELEHREKELRIDVVATLCTFLLEEETFEIYASKLQSRADTIDDRFGQSYYPPQASLIEALKNRDTDETRCEVELLVEFHQEFVIGSPDANVVDEAVAFDACAYLALAMQHGLDIAVDSEYIPDVLTDDEYYPVGEA